MARPKIRPGIEFENFLFAPIMLEGNGAPLSVLSALARQMLDPWMEAAALAVLPADVAVQRLASWIGALPGNPPAAQESQVIAMRLIGCLPRKSPTALPIQKAATAVTAKAKSWTLIYFVVVFVALFVQWAVQAQMAEPPPGEAAKAHMATSQQTHPGRAPRSGH